MSQSVWLACAPQKVAVLASTDWSGSWWMIPRPTGGGASLGTNPDWRVMVGCSSGEGAALARCCPSVLLNMLGTIVVRPCSPSWPQSAGSCLQADLRALESEL
jgi:hypothetical protein